MSDSMKAGAQGTMSRWRVFAYSFGDVANNLSFQMTSMFLMVYMTDIAGIAAGTAGAIYGLTKIWAGITDLTAGTTVDKANTKWGHLRPWLLWSSTPLAVAFVLLFSNPLGLSGTAIVAWVFLFDAAFQLCYSFINIPYGSLSAAMTQDPVDRSRLAGMRSIASAVTGVLLSAIVAPQFADVRAKKPGLDLDAIRLQFTITCLILAAIAVALYVICFLNTREVVPRSPGKVKLSSTMKMVGKNRPLLVLCLAALFLLGSMFTMNAVAMYFVRDVIGSASFFTVLMLCQTVGTILAASLVPMITVRLGKKLGYVGCAGVVGLAYGLLGFVPAGGYVVAGVVWFLIGVGTGGTNSLMFSMQADTVDYGEWKTGTRAEGGSYSILSFIRKVGQGVGGWGGAAVIAAFGYGIANADPDRVETGLRVATGWLPAALAVVAGLVILLYPLGAEEHKKVIADLTERRIARAAEDAGVALPADKAGGQPVRPVVTLFEQYGAGADAIGAKVAERLGVPYTSQRLSSERLESADADAAREASGTDRFLRNLSFGGTNDGDIAVVADKATDADLVEQNTKEVLTLLEGKGGVVLGRNATVILADQPGALHVRLTGPLQDRIARAAAAAGIDTERATLRQQREDRVRVEISQRLYGWNPSEDRYYDLVIDTGQTSPEQAVDLIVQAYRQRFGG